MQQALASLKPAQREIANLVLAEAQRQGVPPELALAFAELESGFANIKAVNGKSYGPMQTHVSALLPGETEAQLANMAFSIPRGMGILKQRLARAGNDTTLCRVMYFCGVKWEKSCSEAALARLKARWAPAAARWGVPATYAV